MLGFWVIPLCCCLVWELKVKIIFLMVRSHDWAWGLLVPLILVSSQGLNTCSNRRYLNWRMSLCQSYNEQRTKLLSFPQSVHRLHVSMWRPQTSAMSKVISVCILLSSPHAFFSVQTHLQPCPNASQITLLLMWLLYLNRQYWQGGNFAYQLPTTVVNNSNWPQHDMLQQFFFKYLKCIKVFMHLKYLHTCNYAIIHLEII